jgi:isoaspartyl peptidase/L-asparaginase-like protein (Ntn-hydrolase superfamily)
MTTQPTGPIFIATWPFGEQAVRAAWSAWQARQDLAEACVDATAQVELDPEVPTVGIGGLPNREGVMELDAGFMRGDDLRCGSVAALRVTCPAIRAAHAVATQTNHVMLAGRGADDFALQQGLPRYAPDDLLTDKTRAEYQVWKEKVEAGEVDVHQMVGHDTLGLLGYHAGRTVACVATSGLGFKRPGRVGDSPIVGGGLYADDEAGCAACTGIGEELARHAAAIRVVDALRAGQSPDRACASVLEQMIERDPANARRGLSILAINKQGDAGAATTRNRNHLFEYHACRAGDFERVEPTPITAPK